MRLILRAHALISRDLSRDLNFDINVNKNEKVIILSLSVLNVYLIINFKSNAFKTIMVFDEICFEIKIKLNKSLIFFLIIIYFCSARLIYFKPRYIRSKSSIYNDYLTVFHRLYNRCSIVIQLIKKPNAFLKIKSG